MPTHQFQKPLPKQPIGVLALKDLMVLDYEEVKLEFLKVSQGYGDRIGVFEEDSGLEVFEGSFLSEACFTNTGKYLTSRIAAVTRIPSIISQAFKTQTSIHLSDPYTSPLFTPSDYPSAKNLSVVYVSGVVVFIVNGDIDPGLIEFFGIALENARKYEKSIKTGLESSNLLLQAKKEAEKSKILLIAAKITAKAASQEKLIQDILTLAKQFLNAQECSLFLLDTKKQELYSSVFADGIERKIRFPITTGVAGSVASTSKPENIPNAYDDPRFNPEFDKLNSFKTQSMLCVPIFGPNGEIVGVTTIINKLDPKGQIIAFNSDDLELYEGISVFCGLAIHKMLLIQESQNQNQKLAITLELIGFHSSTSAGEVDSFLANEPGLFADESMISWYQYDPHQFLNTDDTLAAISHQMFSMCKFDEMYDIPDFQLIDYLLTVRRSYRPIAYHNFTHAVSVTHGFFVLIVNGVLDNYFTKLEMFAMLVACLNHDIDHRGTNNAFQQKTHSVFASFYNTSTMERHHVNHCMTILNSNSGSVNILRNLSQEDYKSALEVIEGSILATDLALFFGAKKKLSEIMIMGGFDNSIPEHHLLLRGVIMTCSDLCAMYKPFEGARHTANSVYEEFFQQGDQEKSLGIPYTSELTDRSKHSEIPRMQVGFYNFVVIPAFDCLYTILGEPVKNMLDACKENKLEWELLQKSGEPYEYQYDGPVSKLKNVAVPKFMKKVICEDTNGNDSDSMNSRQSSVG